MTCQQSGATTVGDRIGSSQISKVGGSNPAPSSIIALCESERLFGGDGRADAAQCEFKLLL